MTNHPRSGFAVPRPRSHPSKAPKRCDATTLRLASGERDVYRSTPRGPLLPFALGAFRRSVSQCVACRVPARRAGNFHLLVQMKVTKANDLNTHLCRPHRMSVGLRMPGACVARPGRACCRVGAPRCIQVACTGWRPRRTDQIGVQPLCFGDFHLGPQMKVTRPPGRDPARGAVSNTSMKRAGGQRQQGAASRRSFHAPQRARSAVEQLT